MFATDLAYSTIFLVGFLALVLFYVYRDHRRSKVQKNVLEPLPTVMIDEKGQEFVLVNCDPAQQLKDAPGPRNVPIIGSTALFSLGAYEVPYQAFKPLVKRYNCQVIRMRLGQLDCVVVNGLENIKEVMIAKGHHFDSRPNFERYNRLFDGDKSNSLAFSDWSEVQKMRRGMLTHHAFPRNFTTKFDVLNEITTDETQKFCQRLLATQGAKLAPKNMILYTCANIFSRYFCSRGFEPEDPGFRDTVLNFDRVFIEVNQGYAADFIPSLMSLHNRRLALMATWSREIRRFVEDRIIEKRFDNWDESQANDDDGDYVGSLIRQVKKDNDPNFQWDTALFALEDVIGGHAAVGNFLMKVFAYLVSNKEVQETAQKEIDALNFGEDSTIGLDYRKSLPYIEAIIYESLRLIASPIVPHVANRDSSINGYKVYKNDFLFLDNYDLNMSEDLWVEPREFQPTRFIRDGKIFKPEYFMPFGSGRRMCVGFKMVQFVAFTLIANTLKNFTIMPTEKKYQVPVGNLALPAETFSFSFVRR